MPIRAAVLHCIGDQQKANWLLVRHVPGAARCIICFPGDISDFAVGDKSYRYSLESLLWVLTCKYPEDTVVLVRPRMMVGLFAAYVNFMFVDSTGSPRPMAQVRGARSDAVVAGAEAAAEMPLQADADAEAEEEERAPELPRAAAHLEALLHALEERLGESLPEALSLVGFSKGATVLTCLLRELADAQRPESRQLWSRATSVHFVDAGLHVPGECFPSEAPALRSLAEVCRRDFAVWIHGTPRQLQDPRRPFVAAETDAFAARCREAGLRVERRLYAEGQELSLDMHFDCLRCFYTGDDDREAGDRHSGFFARWAEEIEAAEAAAAAEAAGRAG
eukprot:TRINITY_DN76074_c0_g1_i1.p1 TRINITY_DN76074_c0_g1~~TRINITY_DN76074_c0_g1_i1.p1  ORF type:complete len:335 (+),score=82.18 TRINITY_DN76074_c0_g1_i1:44-1048(+)